VAEGDLEDGRLRNWLGLREQADRQAARRDVVTQLKNARVLARQRRAAKRQSLRE
jgi:hypothetical protein